MLAVLSLAAYLSSCAPAVAPSTMAAIVGVESGGNPFALHDNTTQRAYAPRDARTALAIVTVLLSRGHSVDVGIAQVNSANFAGYRVDSAQMLEPCANLKVASHILSAAYTRAAAQFPSPREALWHAISAYNTGSLFAGRSYVEAVVGMATRSPIVPSIALLTATVPVAVEPVSLILPPVQSTTRVKIRTNVVQRIPRLVPVRASSPFGLVHVAGVVRTLPVGIDHGRS